MNNAYDNNYIKNTPDFVYSPPQPMDMRFQKSTYEMYVSRFKTAIYGAIIFTIFSLPFAYKILDIIGKLFSNNVELIDEYGEVQPFGRFIMALLVGILLFIL